MIRRSGVRGLGVIATSLAFLLFNAGYGIQARAADHPPEFVPDISGYPPHAFRESYNAMAALSFLAGKWAGAVTLHFPSPPSSPTNASVTINGAIKEVGSFGPIGSLSAYWSILLIADVESDLSRSEDKTARPTSLRALSFDADKGKYQLFEADRGDVELVDAFLSDGNTISWTKQGVGPCFILRDKVRDKICKTTITVKNGIWHETDSVANTDGSAPFTVREYDLHRVGPATFELPGTKE